MYPVYHDVVANLQTVLFVGCFVVMIKPGMWISLSNSFLHVKSAQFISIASYITCFKFSYVQTGSIFVNYQVPVVWKGFVADFNFSYNRLLHPFVTALEGFKLWWHKTSQCILRCRMTIE